MAALKGFANQISGAKTTGGSANAQTLTSDSVAAISTAYAAGMIFCVKAGFTNSTTTPTFNVDGVGAKTIKKGGAQAALAAGDITAGGIYWLAYEASGDCFLLLNPDSGSVSSQPLDPTLTAFSALSWSSGNPLLQFTAADTVSLTLTPSVTNLTVSGVVSAPDGTAAAPSLKVGDEQNGLYSPAANQLALALGGVAYVTFSATATSFASQSRITLAAGSATTPPLVIRAADTGTGWYSVATNNWGWTANGTKYADWSATLFDFIAPTRAPLAVSSETTGVLTTASANKKVKMSGDCTINDGVFAANDWIIFENNSASTRQIIQDTGMTLRLHGSTSTGTRTVAVRGGASVGFDTNAEAIVYGDVT